MSFIRFQVFAIAFLLGMQFVFGQNPKPEQDCINAIPVCKSIYNFPTPYIGPGNIPSELNNDFNCILSEDLNSVWFKLSVKTGGQIHFTITPEQIQDDYDWSLFNLSNHACSDIKNIPTLSVSCNNSQMGMPPGITGISTSSNQNSGDQHSSPFNKPINVSAGQVYYLVVTSSAPTDGFTIDFTKSTAVFGDDPLQFSASDVDCKTDSIIIKASKNVMCSSIAADGSDFRIEDTEGNIYPAVSSKAVACASGATTKEIVVKYAGEPMNKSNFHIYVKNGIDGNTLQDECGQFVPDNTKISSIKADNCKTDSVRTYPNVITPNSDGVNDHFKITGNDGNSKLKIFNRWGLLVYETEAYKNDWDGGNVAPGVYFYVFEPKDGKFKSGSISIIR